MSRINADEFENLPWLHLYGQYVEHSSAAIIGNATGLKTLRDAIDKALEGQTGDADVFCTDGEGYGIKVTRTNHVSMPSPLYGYQAINEALDHERDQAERNDSLRTALSAGAGKESEG